MFIFVSVTKTKTEEFDVDFLHINQTVSLVLYSVVSPTLLWIDCFFWRRKTYNRNHKFGEKFLSVKCFFVFFFPQTEMVFKHQKYFYSSRASLLRPDRNIHFLLYSLWVNVPVSWQDLNLKTLCCVITNTCSFVSPSPLHHVVFLFANAAADQFSGEAKHGDANEKWRSADRVAWFVLNFSISCPSNKSELICTETWT